MTLLAAGLIVNDLVAISLLGVMDKRFNHFWGPPLAPRIAWPAGDVQWLGLGAITVALLLLDQGIVRTTIPPLAVLGSLVVLPHVTRLRDERE
ncbi:MAG TPA: hypothetical protein VFO07_03720 [Roseiflexaceae bacterium]|nr:hypothetical protein [Roseiflexaceae bacterium]